VNRKSDNSLLAEYRYDAQNRRVQKILPTGTMTYYYAGWKNIEERNSEGLIMATNIYGNYLDEIIEREVTSGATSTKYYFAQNRNYSQMALTSSAGEILERTDYTAYGNPTYTHWENQSGIKVPENTQNATIITTTNSTYENPYSYTGQRIDNETGLHYFKNRYYSSTLV